MGKIAVALLLVALAILAAFLAFEPNLIQAQAAMVSMDAANPISPPLMYAGIRG